MKTLIVIDFPVLAHPTELELQINDANGSYKARKASVEAEFEAGLLELEVAVQNGYLTVFDKHEYSTLTETRMRYILLNQTAQYEYDAMIYTNISVAEILNENNSLADGWTVFATRQTGSETKIIFRREKS